MRASTDVGRLSFQAGSSKHEDQNFGAISDIYTKRKYETWSRYTWKANWEYLVVTLASMTTIRTIYAVTIHQSTADPGFVHYLLSFVLVGLPLCYMQVVLGQYSELGVTVFKYLAPIGHGLGYTLVVNSFLRCAYIGLLLADFIIYLLASFQRELQWMICPENSAKYCWGLNNMKNCTNRCLSRGIDTSAFIYWKEVFMSNINIKARTTSLRPGPPIWPRVVVMGLSWAVVYTLVIMGITKYKKIVLYSFYVLTPCFIVLLLACLTAEGAGDGIRYFFHYHGPSITSVKAWSKSTSDVIDLLALDRVCHVTYGSYMSPTAKSDILAMALVFMTFCFCFCGALMTHACIGIIASEAKTNLYATRSTWKFNTVKYLSMIPQALGFLGGPHLWTVLYFFISVLLIVNNQVAQVDSIERCLADAHPFIRNYRKYIVATICLAGMLIGTLLSAKESFLPMEELYYCALRLAKTLDIFLISVFLSWVYTVQRFSDDIHFNFGRQPTKYWKVCWYFMPVIVGITNGYYTFGKAYKVRHDKYIQILHYTMYVLAICPIPIMAVFEIFGHLRRHNLVGLIQPKERWGPSDPKERHLRRTFNPREEVKFRRRNDACQHNCLLGSKIFQNAVTAEKAYQKEMGNGYVTYSESSDSSIVIIS